ncbi:MAG: SpoIIE family protein phosphatase, partial [Actinobacteria bacterium]|nr:SpoIIE family protein phosphatase [Actinomycetota bacterium]
PLIGPWHAGARAVLPISQASMTLGALEVCWPEAIGEFDPPLRRQLRGLADLCARTLGSGQGTAHSGAEERGAWILGLIDGLADSVLLANPVRNSADQVTDFRLGYVSPGFVDPANREAAELTDQCLLAAYPGAALPGGLFDAAVTALETGQPQRIVDAALLPQPADRVSARVTRLFDGVAISLRSASEPERLAALLDQAQRLGRIGGWEEVLATGAVSWTEATFALFGVASPIRLADLDDLVPAEDVPAVAAFRDRLLRDTAPAVAAFRITRRDDGSVRQIRAFAEPVLDAARHPVAILGAYQDVSDRYHTEVALAVTRGRLTETEQRAAEKHRLALRLQEAITPHSSHLLEAGDLAVAARYRPASEENLVSGDWYDAVPLPTGQVMLVVGDIAGHGIDAVTGMVALRNSLRGLALTGAGPARLLSLLNNVCTELTEGVLGTAVCALYDPRSRVLCSALAGHLPIILVRSGRAHPLAQPSGILLGAAADVSYDEAATTLQAGDTILLYTDGLIERREQPIDVCLDALIATASRPVTDVNAYADLLAAEATSDTGDDACLLAVSVR